MLKSTFMHIPGVSQNKEMRFWQNGLRKWDDFEKDDFNGCSHLVTDRLIDNVKLSKKHLRKDNHSFFSESLPLNEHWRAYPEFRKNCCFLDIETTGLSRERNKITTIGVYNGKESRVFVRHDDIDEFVKEIKKYSMIVTFNGRCFDIPFIKAKYPEINFDHLHIDLRFVMKNLGFTGGLKNIEREMGIKRDDEVEGVDGYEAVRLWYKYRAGNQSALDKLVAYNKADVENLQGMMDFAYANMKKKVFPFSEN